MKQFYLHICALLITGAISCVELILGGEPKYWLPVMTAIIGIALPSPLPSPFRILRKSNQELLSEKGDEIEAVDGIRKMTPFPVELPADDEDTVIHPESSGGRGGGRKRRNAVLHNLKLLPSTIVLLSALALLVTERTQAAKSIATPITEIAALENGSASLEIGSAFEQCAIRNRTEITISDDLSIGVCQRTREHFYVFLKDQHRGKVALLSTGQWKTLLLQFGKVLHYEKNKCWHQSLTRNNTKPSMAIHYCTQSNSTLTYDDEPIIMITPTAWYDLTWWFPTITTNLIESRLTTFCNIQYQCTFRQCPRENE